MSQLLMQSRNSIAAWLLQSAPEVRELDVRRWEITFANGLQVAVAAPVDNHFLLFDAAAPVACELDEAPQWLRWNAELDGFAKIALAPGPWQVRLRAEVPIDEEADMAARIAGTLRGMQDAYQRLAHKVSAPAAAQPAAKATTSHASGSLSALLRETGWLFQERSGGVAAVEIAIRGASICVSLHELPGGAHAALELLRMDAPAAVSATAVAALLLCAGSSLRLARPFAADADGQLVCGFEVRSAGAMTAAELVHALEALVVAGWACKEEVHSLLDNAVAGSYLAIRKLSPTLAREECT